VPLPDEPYAHHEGSGGQVPFFKTSHERLHQAQAAAHFHEEMARMLEFRGADSAGSQPG